MIDIKICIASHFSLFLTATIAMTSIYDNDTSNKIYKSNNEEYVWKTYVCVRGYNLYTIEKEYIYIYIYIYIYM